MKKISLILVCTIGLGIIANAQDVITLKNGTDIKAVIQDIGNIEVKYKKFDNLNGPNYTLEKSEILMIRYENGTKDIFSEETKSNDNSAINTNFILKKNSKIFLDLHPKLTKSQQKKVSNLFEENFKKIGVCCVYKADIDSTNNTADIVIKWINRPFNRIAIQIFDNTLKSIVFDEKYILVRDFKELIDQITFDISLFIEK